MNNNLLSSSILKWLIIFFISLPLTQHAIADEDYLKIKSASYDAKKQRLKVKVKMKGEKPYQLALFDAINDQLLLQKSTNKRSLKLQLKNIQGSAVPCSVKVTLNHLIATRKVKKAPENCSTNLSETGIVTEIKIEDAEYEDNKLKVKGEFKGNLPNTVKLYDDQSGILLSDNNRSDEASHFSFKVYDLTQIPCRIRIQADQSSATKQVEDAPDNCDTPPPPENQPPVCSIISPANEIINIALGESINFAGTASDPENRPLTYEWDFNGGADIRPTELLAGDIPFDVKNGRFLVHLYVTDEQGARCTDNRTVNVGTDNPDIPTGMVPQQAAPGTAAAGDGQHVILPVNDLGMHCADLGSYPLSILPPFNTLNAHAILKGSTGANKPRLLDANQVIIKYSAASNPSDPVGPYSINSTSQNYPVGSKLRDASIRKSDFWDDINDQSIASLLFPGLDPAPDEGLLTLDNLQDSENKDQEHGRYMPGIEKPYFDNIPQSFSKFIEEFGWFTAQGIPMTSVDDQGAFNSYPMMRVQMISNIDGAVLATTDTVVPVSTEVDCRDCHTLGEVGADIEARENGPVFEQATSNDRLDVETAAKINILRLHDFNHGTHFDGSNKPVLCAACHQSNALASVGGPAGIDERKNMSNVMHGYHGRLQLDSPGGILKRNSDGSPDLIEPKTETNYTSLIPFGADVPMEENCFQCHPGKITQCFRGAMYTAGQTCDSCHGDMLAVGGEFEKQDGSTRTPWVDEPTCGSCHSGIGSEPVANTAYAANDPAAEPLAAKTPRFAENDQTLYRNSLDGHAKLGCVSCHGSPHAIWPNRNPDANDNVMAIQLQGHAGTLSECTTCHEDNSFPNGTLGGPHGMHPVNDPNWIDEDGHGDFAEDRRNGDRCADCHGEDHLGTRLSKVPVDRVLKNSKGKVLANLRAGDQVACNLCHSLSKSFDD